MSQSGGPASRSNPPKHGRPSGRLQEGPQTSPTSAPLNMHAAQTAGGRDASGGAGMSLPPLRHVSGTPPTPSSETRLGSRPLGLQSMLNPQSELVERRGNRRSAAQMESPSPIDSTPAPSIPSLSRPPSVDSSQEDIPMSRPFPAPAPGFVRTSHRNLLSPRSPNLHRTQSLGVLNPPTGTIDAHQSPFLSPGPRSHVADAGAAQAAPLPTPPTGARTGYFGNVPHTVPTPPPGHARADIRRQSTGFAQSGSASPMTSYSPYSQPASIASSVGGQFEQSGASSQSGSYISIPNTTQGQENSNSEVIMETERGYIPVASTGQSSYQILTMKTHQGHHVQIPVDVSAASKQADEKRKRNAGASARFRARRKEKEREASTTIQKLEQQLREATDDMEFYRGERDHFRSIVYSQPGADRLYPRPASPRRRRLSTPSTASTSNSGPYAGYPDSADQMDSDRNVRRRTSSYHPVSGPPPTSLNGPISQQPLPQQSFPAPAFPSIVPAPQSAQQMPRAPASQQPDPRGSRQPSEMQQPVPQGPTLRDPFARDSRRYGDRSWPPPLGRDQPR